MAIDWERVIVESDDNGVVVSAGQVSLLIGADADSVSWGNITGDITQQPDLMQIVDGYVSADSPTFTGIPRSVTPPEGNNSTRIATTAFVQGEINPPKNSYIYGRSNGEWVALSKFASKDNIDYSSDVVNKPTLGSLASKDTVNYETDVTNKPTLGSLASKDTVNYDTDVTNKPEPPGNSGDDKKVYGRTSYAGTHGWQKLGAMSLVNEPPAGSGNISEIFYCRSVTQNGTRLNYQWTEVPLPELSSNPKSNPEVYVMVSYMMGTPPNHYFHREWAKIGTVSSLHDIGIDIDTGAL